MSRLGQAALVAAAPAAGVLLAAVTGLDLLAAVPLLVLLTAIWLLFVVQYLSGRTGRAFMAYGRMRTRTLSARHPDEGGRRLTLGPPRQSRNGLPKLAWSHDGWAHADGHLAGLAKLGEWFDITAFGCESRWRGEPPVPLELLPAKPYGPGIRLEGLEDRLREFDVVWTGSPYDGTTWQALEARSNGGPAVVSIEVENIVGNYVGPGHELRRRPIAEIDHFCATSSTAAGLLLLDGVEPERISLVPMAVDVPQFNARDEEQLRARGRAALDADERDVVVTFLGRLIPDKGINGLIGAVAWARRWPGGDRLRLVIAGEGESAHHLRALASHYGIDSVTTFLEFRSPEERRELLAASDVISLPSLVVPYWSEQFGRVLPEAFMFGVPAIGSDAGAIPEVLGDAGIVVRPGDFGALAGALLEISDDDRRSALSARARARADEYSLERFAERLRVAFGRAIERRRLMPR